ncbi:MAG: hypothetical protein KGJ13_06850 [Patescibacteria group bacterium]|nr:hypothetical protein [Patescibacteria group bacterium]
MPDVFAENVLGLNLYPIQKAVLRALAPAGSTISFRSCNEGGKTRCVIGPAILWHLSMFPKGPVISTSGSYRQIKDQLLPSLHTFSPRFPAWDFLKTPRIETQNVNGFWEGFSTNDAGKFEGHHAGPDSPLLLIVDEAKTVRDDIFEAIERCKPTRLLIASSPGYAEGEFFRSQKTARSKFYKTFVQRAVDCPHWKESDIKRLREKWGKDHPLYRSMVEAEFMESVSDAVVNLKALEELLAEPPEHRPGEKKAFCDFAWGGDGDENVLAFRDGNLVSLEEMFRADNLHAICGRFISGFSRLGLKPDQIEGDESGGGKLICDQLQAMGWRIGRVNNGSKPRNDHYANAGAEMWWEGAKKIERREIILPDDDDSRAQILDRKRIPHLKGKLAIESKRDMKARGVTSPDRADAIFGVMMPLRRVESFNLSNRQQAVSFSEQVADWNEKDSTLKSQLPGAFFG